MHHFAYAVLSSTDNRLPIVITWSSLVDYVCTWQVSHCVIGIFASSFLTQNYKILISLDVLVYNFVLFFCYPMICIDDSMVYLLPPGAGLNPLAQPPMG